MTHRFFKSSPRVYEAIRAQIDAAWGYPTEHTLTSIPPAAEQTKAPDGDCVMGVKTEWLGWEPVASVMPQLLADGLVTEITEGVWAACLPQPE